MVSVPSQVFSNCGKPQLGPSRRRRRRDVYDGDYDDYEQGRVMNDGRRKVIASAKENDDDEDDEDDDDNEYVDSKPTVVRNEKKERVILPPEDGDRKKQRKNKNNNGPKVGGGGSGVANNKNRKKNKSDGLEDEEEDQGGPAFAFHRLLKDIGTHVASTKNFWKRLPYEVCNNEVAVIETGQNTTCWNGSSLARFAFYFCTACAIDVVTHALRGLVSRSLAEISSKNNYCSHGSIGYFIRSYLNNF